MQIKDILRIYFCTSLRLDKNKVMKFLRSFCTVSMKFSRIMSRSFCTVLMKFLHSVYEVLKNNVLLFLYYFPMSVIFKLNRHVSNYNVCISSEHREKILINMIDELPLFYMSNLNYEVIDDYTLRLTAADNDDVDDDDDDVDNDHDNADDNDYHDDVIPFETVLCHFDIYSPGELTIDEYTVTNCNANIAFEGPINVTMLNSKIFANSIEYIYIRKDSKIINSTIFGISQITVDKIDIENEFMFIDGIRNNIIIYPPSHYVPSVDETMIVIAIDDYVNTIQLEESPGIVVFKNFSMVDRTICVKNVRKFIPMNKYAILVGDDDMSIYKIKFNCIESHEHPEKLNELRKKFHPKDIVYDTNIFNVEYTDDVLLQLEYLKEHPYAYEEDLEKIFSYEPIKLVNIGKGAKLFMCDKILNDMKFCVSVKENKLVALDTSKVIEMEPLNIAKECTYNFIPNLLMKVVLGIDNIEHKTIKYSKYNTIFVKPMLLKILESFE